MQASGYAVIIEQQPFAGKDNTVKTIKQLYNEENDNKETRQVSRKKIICESTYFYGLTQQNSYAFRLMLRFCDPIEETVLRQALALTVQRYPYYMVRCISDGREYWLEPNDRPFELHHTSEPLVMGSKEVNYYLWAVSYHGDTLWLNFFHGLADGSAAMHVLRTLTYYYCRDKYDKNLASDGIRVGEVVPADEMENPYEKLMLQWAADQGAAPKRQAEASGTEAALSLQPLNLFEDSRLHITAPVNHKLKIRQKDLMQYCREQDGTPGVVTSLLLARAVDAVNPGKNRPIVTGMAMNLRPALEAPDYMGSPIGIAYLSYDGKLKEKPFTTQATGYRGRLIIASDPDRLRLGSKKSCTLYGMIDSLPKLADKKAAMLKVLKSMQGRMASFAVSYLGPANLGAVEPYVKEIRALIGVGENAILVEIMSANGYFYLDFAQQWQEEIYFDAFCQQLSLQGIPYELDGIEIHNTPGTELP